MKLVETWIWLLLVAMYVPGAICQDRQFVDLVTIDVDVFDRVTNFVTNVTDSLTPDVDVFDRVTNFVTNVTDSLTPGVVIENITQQVFGPSLRTWGQNLGPGGEYIASCGSTSTDEDTLWQNSKYPEIEDLPGICTIKLLPPAGTCAFRIHFHDLDLMPPIDQLSFSPGCPSSKPFFKATTPDDLTAVYCQKMDSYEGILPISDTTEPTILLLQLDPSVEFKFKVQATAVNCNDIKTYESPSNCGIKNQDLATLRAELFGISSSGVRDFEESQDSVVVEYDDHIPLEYRQKRRNPIASDNQNNKNKNKNKENNKNKNTKDTTRDTQKNNKFEPPVMIDFSKGVAEAEAAGEITKVDGSRVIGAQTTLINEWPWIVYIEVRIEDYVDRPSCNGLLLDDSKILTSRDCAMVTPQQPYGVENMYVTIGDHDISSTTETESKTVTVSKVTLPLKNGLYDTKDAFAVLHLSEKVELSETIRPICLPVSYNKFDDSGVVCGWDFVWDSYDDPTFPNEAKVKLTDQTLCSQTLYYVYNYYNYDNAYHVNFHVDDVVCALESKYDDGVICRGESGSALVQRDRRGAYYVTGVAGFLNECYYSDFPNYFSKVEPDNQFLNIALA